MPIKKKDFVQVDYTGRIKETNEVFDTTDKASAQKHNIFSPKGSYEPITICVGEAHILKGIDEFIEGKEPGNYTVELEAEKAFGKKDPALLKMIPISQFQEQGIKPVPGLRLNIDGYVGTVKTVTGGRTVVDFNHPLAGRAVVYDLKVGPLVTDKKKQVESTLRLLLGIKADVAVDGKKATVTMPQLPPQLQTELAKKLAELTGMEVAFVAKKADKADVPHHDHSDHDHSHHGHDHPHKH